MLRFYVRRDLNYIPVICGPDSVVGMANSYGLDGPGSNTGRGDFLLQSRPALGPPSPL